MADPADDPPPRRLAEIEELLAGIARHAERVRRELPDHHIARQAADEIDRAVERLRRLHAGPSATDGRGRAPGRERILLVEDDPQVRTLLTRALERLDLDVEVAANGREALDAVENGAPAPDILVTDVVMPKLGGRELAVRLRLRDPNLKVLFVSGYSHGSLDARFLRRPGTAFLQKPFTPRELARALSDLRSREQAQRA